MPWETAEGFAFFDNYNKVNWYSQGLAVVQDTKVSCCCEPFVLCVNVTRRLHLLYQSRPVSPPAGPKSNADTQILNHFAIPKPAPNFYKSISIPAKALRKLGGDLVVWRGEFPYS